MIDYRFWFDILPFSIPQKEKDALYVEAMEELSRHHAQNCSEYRRLSSLLGSNPVLPVRLFKEFDLLSTDKQDIYKILKSSGTSGQAVSKIFLDKETAFRQTKALSKIVSDFTGKTRMPMLMVDSASVLKDRQSFSARGAGILGFSIFGRSITYALDENMNLDIASINAFCEKHSGEDVLVFGFTSIIWQFVQQLLEHGITLHLNGLMIHGGGWKKLANLSVSKEEFKRSVRSATGIERVLNYYGMAEQTGSVFMECEAGHLHASIFSDILIRRYNDFSLAGIGERGFVELMSILPTSYPGHILITEDEGVIIGEDDCPCGRLGRYFNILGRIQAAEVRGCSDTYE